MNGNRVLVVVLACLAACAFAAAPRGNAATGFALMKPSAGSGGNVIEAGDRRHGRPLYLPIAPNYLAYDYPYYYRRGFYPRHVGPGYIYYGYPYFYRNGSGRGCSKRVWRCVANLRDRRGHLRERRTCKCR